MKSVAFEFPVVTGQFSLKPLSAYWKGRVEVWGKDKKGNWEKLDSEEVSIGQKEKLVLTKESSITKNLVFQRLAAAPGKPPESESVQHFRTCLQGRRAPHT